MNLFGHGIPLQASFCSLNGEPRGGKEPQVNLYVRLTDHCQAKCRFCTFCKDPNRVFNEDRLYFLLHHISKQVRINKVSFTGGEPTIFLPILHRVLKMTKEILPDVFTVVSTNGFALNDLNVKNIDSIALSRHGIGTEENAEIFQSHAIPTEEYLAQYEHKDKVHITCNLMKSHINSPEKAYRFLEHYGSMGYSDFGFVTLMPVNDFTRAERVRISNAPNSVDLGKMPRTITSKRWTRDQTCACNNYVVSTGKGDLLRVYARETIDSNRCEGLLVYDVNFLKIGFNGEVIYGE